MRKFIAMILAASAFAGTSGLLAQVSGDDCDRTLPREAAPPPDFSDQRWMLVDSGNFQFDYRFYAPKNYGRVTAMTTEGDREGTFKTVKVSWQMGDEIYSVRLGPEGRGEPVCVRKIRGHFDLHQLYLRLKPNLRR